jgi:hypothetical protein
MEDHGERVPCVENSWMVPGDREAMLLVRRDPFVPLGDLEKAVVPGTGGRLFHGDNVVRDLLSEAQKNHRP